MPIRALPSFSGAEKGSTPASNGGRSANCASAAACNSTPAINPAINGIANVEVIHLHSIVRSYTEEWSLRQTIALSEAEAKDKESEPTFKVGSLIGRGSGRASKCFSPVTDLS
jgi:hypothetical protein